MRGAATVTIADIVSQSGTLEINGARIAYDVAGSPSTDAGQRPPLVLLHAGIADRRMWDAQMSAFAGNRRVIRYDMRGFGDSTTPDVAYSPRDDLAALLRHLDASPAIVCGCSFGARIAVEFALEYADAVQALVLVAPALGGFPFSSALDDVDAQIEAAFEAGDLDRAAELDLRTWVDGPQRSPAQVDPAFRERARVMARRVYAVAAESRPRRLEPPAAGRLVEIRVPTLVVAGDLDQPDILTIANLLAVNIRGARQHVIAGTAHLPNMERPDEFNGVVLEFLRSIPARPADGIALREIGPENWRAVVDLELAGEQRDYVDPNAVSLAESRVHPWMLPLAIERGGEVVGFVMYSRWPDPREGNYWIHRFMIDRRQQGKGYGRAALQAVIGRFEADPHCASLWVGYVPHNDLARRFYASLGFVEQGEAPWGGDWVAKLELSTSPAS
jgi:pimeloyl-ACP methyl ester carboxylesterase/GNAT superfamily N-acetyltransferase